MFNRKKNEEFEGRINRLDFILKDANNEIKFANGYIEALSQNATSVCEMLSQKIDALLDHLGLECVKDERVINPYIIREKSKE